MDGINGGGESDRTIFACQDTSGDEDGMVDNDNGDTKIALVHPSTMNENPGVKPPVKKQVSL